MSIVDDAIAPLLGGSAIGAAVGLLAAMLVTTCGPVEELDEHETRGFVDLVKLPAEPAVIFPADRCQSFGGEKIERDVARGEPQS